MLYNGNIELYQRIMAKRKREESFHRSLIEGGYYKVTEKGHIKTAGPPPGWIGPPPPKSCELYVGRIPFDVSELELWMLFKTVGHIYEQRLMIDVNGENRGFAFVHYIEQQDADRAVAELNKFEIRLKHKIVVSKSFKSIDNRCRFINGIPTNKNHQELQAEKESLAKGVSKVTVFNNILDKNKTRGFARIEYVNYRAASKARPELIPKVIKLWGSETEVYWAVPEKENDEDIMSKITNIYVRNLSPTTTKQYLRDILNQVTNNDVLRVEMMGDFALIHFTSHKSAEKAIQTFDGTEINRSKVEVTWAGPQQDTKSTNSKPASRKRSSVSVGSMSSVSSYEPVAKRSLSFPNNGILPSQHSS